jgi:hypothetical protein
VCSDEAEEEALQNFCTPSTGHDSKRSSSIPNSRGSSTLTSTLPVVRCLPLGVILGALDAFHINFFVLDVEGAEMSILTSLDWARFFFDVLAIESQYSSEDNDAIQRFLSDRGYDIWGAIWDEKGLNAEEEGKTRANNWFVRRGFQPSHGPADGTGQAPSPGAHGNIGNTLGSRCGCHSDRSATFWVAGLGERRRLVGTTSRSASTTYVHSVCTRRNPAPLDPRKSRNNVMRCVLVGEEGDGEVMQPARAELQCFHCGSTAARCLCSRRWLRARTHPTVG